MSKIFVVIADPTRSLHDRESGLKFAGDLVRQIETDPFPSQKVKDWLNLGAIREVQPEDVQFFYSLAELNQMKKEQLTPIAQDWDISVTDDEGKEKTRAQLIEELSAKLGAT